MLEDTDYMVTLDTELEHVKAYTMLEEQRFEKRLSIEINADRRLFEAVFEPDLTAYRGERGSSRGRCRGKKESERSS